MKKLLLIAALLFSGLANALVVAPPQAPVTNIYEVDFVRGNNANPCTTTRPCKTVSVVADILLLARYAYVLMSNQISFTRCTPFVAFNGALINPFTSSIIWSGGVKLAAPVVLVNQAGEAVDFLTDTELRATPLSVTVTNPSGGITGYATEATLQVIAAKPNAPSVVGLDAPTLAALETITANTGGLTDTQLRASALPISGTVTANTGLVQPLTDTQLRATALNVTVSNQLDGYASEATLGLVKTVLDSIDAKTTSTVSVTNFPATQPVTLSSIPLASNAANADFQADANLLLEEIEAKSPVLENGRLPVNSVSSNITGKFREAFESYTPGVKWNETKADGDLVYVDGNAAATSYLVISKSPLTAGNETSIETIGTFNMPVELSFGAHISQRTLGQEFSFELVDTNTPLPDVPELTISSISQTTTTLTINFASPHGLSIGKSIGVSGVTDSRANYPSLVVATIPTPLQITCTGGPMNTLPSLTIAQVNNSGVVFFRERLGRAHNGVSQIFENVTTTNASGYVRSESGDAFPSGVIFSNHSIACGSTASTQLLNAANTYAFAPTTEFRIVTQADRVQWYDSNVDTTNQTSNRLLRTQVCPDPSKTYKFRIRTKNNKSLTVPTAQIVSVTKSGSTTATIVFDRPHGLTTTDQIVAYGVRDQTNFANLTAATAIASVVNTTTITCIWGASVTATSYGGYVARVNGGNLMSAIGAIAQVASTATLTDGVLTLVGNTTWAGALIGDSLELVGIRNSTNGATLGIDGAWRIKNIATTILTLEPLGFTAPANFTITNCGGGVIKRTDLRVSFVRIFDYERERVELLARPSGDASGAVPVVLQATAGVSGTVTANEGTPVTPTSNIINSAANTNGTIVKASAGNVYAVRASNNGAAACYVKLHNSTTVTVGTTAVADWLLVPAGSSAFLDYGDKGARFGTGICLSITGAIGDTDTTAVALGQVKVVTSFV